MNKKVILGVFAVVAVLITAAVIIADNHYQMQSKETLATVGEDKAGLLYERAMEYMDKGQQDKAIEDLVKITDDFSGSEYFEKALRALSAYYIRQGDDAKAEMYYKRLHKDPAVVPSADKAEAVQDEKAIASGNSPEEKQPTVSMDTSVQVSVPDSDNKDLVTISDTEHVAEYTVKSGDSLYAIAKKFNTTIPLIKSMNGLNSDIIHPGQTLKINTGIFSIKVDKSDNIMWLYKDGALVKTYTVSTGRNNSTPVGVFTIVDKMIEPAWTKPGVGIVMPDDEEYELGARWMPISIEGYGIHGTNDETSIGKQSTAGCIRMYNADVIELYDTVPKGTKVEIQD